MARSAPQRKGANRRRWWQWRGPAPRDASRAAPGAGPGRRLSVERLEPRAMLASDLAAVRSEGQAGGLVEEAAAWPAMEMRVEVSRLDGSPASTLQVGEPFVLTVATRDLRAEAEGVFAVYVDVRWNADLAVVAGPAQFAAPFVNAPSGAAAAGGLEELGAFAGLEPTREGSYAVVRVPMQAVAPGGLDFTPDPADELPIHALLLYGRDDAIDPAEVRLVGAKVVVEGGPLALEPSLSATDPVAAADSGSNAQTLLVAATLEAGGPVRATSEGSTSAGGAAGDGQDQGSLPERDLWLSDAGADPPRRPGEPSSNTADASEEALPPEENLADESHPTADPGSLLA